MPAAHPDTVLQHVRSLVGAPGLDLSDGQLLELFTARREEAAFEALVRRHGPLVLGACRRALRDPHDADDAFQATFLVLARKAHALDRRGSVAGWLYTVAQRICLKTRAGRRRPPPPPPAAAPPADPLDLLTGKELCAILDEELRRLPERYRLPLLLCCLEGLSRDEAAQQLGWSPGALKGRLERGRELLRVRLTRRGVALSAALLTAALVQQAAAVPAPLVAATLRGAAAPGAAAASITALAEGALHAMALSRWTITAAVLLGLGALATGAGLAARQALAQTQAGPGPRSGAREQPRPAPQEQARTDRYGDPLPPGVVARLGTVRFRQDGWGMEGFAYLPDGKTLLTATREGHALRFWEAATGRLLRTVSTRPLSVRGFALSPDGKRAAVGGFLPDEGNQPTPGVVRVLDLVTGKEVRTFPRTDLDVDHCSLAFSPDGQLLLSLGDSGTFRVEEVATGAELLRQQFPRDLLPTLALSPDGQTAAVASGPNTRKLFLWKWQAGEEPRPLKVGDFVPRWLAFSPDGKLLASTSDREGTTRLWDVGSGQLRQRLRPPGGKTTYTGELTFTPDGKVLAVILHDQEQRPSVHLWDPATGRHRGRLDPGGGRLAVSPDLRLLAAGGPGGVRLWDVASLKAVLPEAEAHHAPIGRVIVSPRGVAVTASDDGTARVWDLATGKPRFLLLLAGGWGAPIETKLTDGRVRGSVADVHPLGLWDLGSGKPVRQLLLPGPNAGPVVFSADGKTYAVAAGKELRQIRLWDATTGKERPGLPELPARATALAFSPDGRFLVTALADTTALVWDLDAKP
jgi:RNA polymerase sigma factor (sigma-70 family)